MANFDDLDTQDLADLSKSLQRPPESSDDEQDETGSVVVTPREDGNDASDTENEESVMDIGSSHLAEIIEHATRDSVEDAGDAENGGNADDGAGAPGGESDEPSGWGDDLSLTDALGSEFLAEILDLAEESEAEDAGDTGAVTPRAGDHEPTGWANSDSNQSISVAYRGSEDQAPGLIDADRTGQQAEDKLGGQGNQGDSGPDDAAYDSDNETPEPADAESGANNQVRTGAGLRQSRRPPSPDSMLANFESGFDEPIPQTSNGRPPQTPHGSEVSLVYGGGGNANDAAEPQAADLVATSGPAPPEPASPEDVAPVEDVAQPEPEIPFLNSTGVLMDDIALLRDHNGPARVLVSTATFNRFFSQNELGFWWPASKVIKACVFRMDPANEEIDLLGEPENKGDPLEVLKSFRFINDLDNAINLATEAEEEVGKVVKGIAKFSGAVLSNVNDELVIKLNKDSLKLNEGDLMSVEVTADGLVFKKTVPPPADEAA